MNIILVNPKNGQSRLLRMNRVVLGVALTGVIGIPALAAYLGYTVGVGKAGLVSDLIAKWDQAIQKQDEMVLEARRDAKANLEVTANRLAKLQARMVRLDALGEHLTAIAKLDKGEFNFSSEPAMGGPEMAGSDSEMMTPPSYMEVLSNLAIDIEDRERQLEILETLLIDRKITSDAFIAGRPIIKGWMSSRFGKRVDPITGKPAWHNGVDFAGKLGSDVVTVASGVVVYAGERTNYGKMVEINHGGGYTTRYGHHKELLVKVGDVVKKGQPIGLMGSSGRSTGPHVHFEVFKNGRVVDPAAYIHRASR
ncbi:MAG: peptidoglycan DD-metalloendopeptidase family protein [Gammaproteobacteria bacterium]|nr:peptidoglycan DD-metalloendopeptidase family protein [Gammaproteobacteria bacterium]